MHFALLYHNKRDQNPLNWGDLPFVYNRRRESYKSPKLEPSGWSALAGLVVSIDRLVRDEQPSAV